MERSQKSPPVPASESSGESEKRTRRRTDDRPFDAEFYEPDVPSNPLVMSLDEPDVRMRFWAVFALGSLGQTFEDDRITSSRVAEALERVLSDTDVAPGNWWSVGTGSARNARSFREFAHQIWPTSRI